MMKKYLAGALVLLLAGTGCFGSDESTPLTPGELDDPDRTESRGYRHRKPRLNHSSPMAAGRRGGKAVPRPATVSDPERTGGMP